MREQKEIDLLLGKNKVILNTRFLGRSKQWKLGKMSLYRQLKLARVYNKLRIDQDKLNSEDSSEQLTELYDAVLKNAIYCGEIIAIAVDSRLPKWLLRRHFMRNVDNKELQEITNSIIKESNLINFSSSIILMNLTRITKPKMMEEK